MNFPLEVNHTITLVTISSESWLTIAIKVSRGIYASCILVAIMAAFATFIDIWVRKWERTICGNSGKLNLINKEKQITKWSGRETCLGLERKNQNKTKIIKIAKFNKWKRVNYHFLLYRHECFTGKYTTCNIKKKLHPGPKWFILHNLTREFIDDVISVITQFYYVSFFEFYLHIFQSCLSFLS